MNKFLFRLTVVFTLLSAFSLSQLTAQNLGQNDTESMLKQYVNEFCTAYSNLPETKDPSTVMRHISKNAKSAIFYFSMAEKVRNFTSSYDGFAKYMDHVAKSEGMTVSYKVKDFLRVRVDSNIATTVFEVDYELEEEGGFHAKGSEIVNFAWKKQKSGDWQIVYFTVMGIEDEKLRGTCLCEIFGSRGQDFVVRTTVPNGRSYDNGFHEFETNKIGSDTYLKAPDGTFFKLTATGEVWELAPDTKPTQAEMVKRLGRAKEVKGAILMIVKSHIYPDRCTKIEYSK
ncbi:MAG: hypothetical protein AB8F95_09500 [Bacteroidia bacterium]